MDPNPRAVVLLDLLLAQGETGHEGPIETILKADRALVRVATADERQYCLHCTSRPETDHWDMHVPDNRRSGHQCHMRPASTEGTTSEPTKMVLVNQAVDDHARVTTERGRRVSVPRRYSLAASLGAAVQHEWSRSACGQAGRVLATP